MKRKHFYSSIEGDEWRGRWENQLRPSPKNKASREIIQAFLSLCTMPATIHYHTLTFKPLNRNGTMTIHIFYDGEIFQLLF